MRAVQYFTDLAHEKAVREIFPAPLMPGAVRAMTGEERFQGFRGFGTALTGSSCYLLSRMEPEKRRAFLQSVFGREGLNLSVARLTIGSSDYSPELYSYDDEPFDTGLRAFSVEHDEAYILPMIREVLAVRPDLTLFASPWSPPGWMKTGGAMCGGFMREEFLECYAEYTVRFVEAYAARGVRIAALTPQNEPETQQGGRMPACIWPPETEAKYIRLLRRKLDGRCPEVKIWLYDHNFDGVGRVLWQLENCPGLAQDCAGAAFHYYAGRIEDTAAVRRQYPGLELHFTEGGPRLGDHYADDWCKWAIMAVKALSQGYRSFTGWNLLLDETGGPNIGPFFCGGLATWNRESGGLSCSGQYRAFAHLAPFLTPESVVAPLLLEQPAGMASYPNAKKPAVGIRIENGEKTVFVLVNPDADKKQIDLSCGGRLWYAELLPGSVSTVVIE